MQPESAPTDKPFPIGFREFVALIASLMAINALSTDPMLPALPAIGAALGVSDPNQHQWVLIAYFLGVGVGALFFGSLSDRFGRRKVMLTSVGVFLAATLACALAQSFPVMLAARATAGFFAAGTRIVTVSIVRDRFQGDRMASVMSLIFIVFILVPVLAPTMGQLILYFANWRWIFGALFLISGSAAIWAAIRLPETLAPENRVEIRVSNLLAVARRIITHRSAIGYMLASGVTMACFVAFLGTSQQIFAGVFNAASIFPYAFAGIAGTMGFGSYFNSRLVHRFGARRMSQASLIVMIGIAGLHVLVAETGYDSMIVFCIFQALMMLTFAFANSNFSAISMEPFAQGAGLAASFQAFLTGLLSALVGAFLGAQYDGTTVPLSFAFLGCGVVALVLVVWAERGRLFTRPGHQEKRPLPAETV